MPLKKRLKPIVCNNLRKIPQSFAWIDHRIRSRRFLADFEPEEFALYLFLACAADEIGLSCWRLDMIEKEMPAFRVPQLHHARQQLIQKRLLAFRPWNAHDPDGTYQLLPVPNAKSLCHSDLQPLIDSIIKTV